MNRTPVTIRAARPTREDGLRFARYLDQAAEGFFVFMLGRQKEDILARAFVEPGHDLSYRNVTFAERDGAVVGMVSGYTAAEHRRSTSRPLREAAGRHNVRMTVVSFLCAPLMRIIDSVADGDFYLQAVAVDPELRGEGVGTHLIDTIEERAVASGSTRLALDVSAGNKGAQKLYERRGMTILSQWPRRVRIPGLKLLRMTKSL